MAAAVVVLGVVFVRKGTTKTSELPVYTLGAERMLAGEEVYRVSDEKPFTYPPFFALPFAPLGHVPLHPPRPWSKILAWFVVNAALLGWILGVVHRALAVPLAAAGGLRPVWFWTLTLTLAARHVSATLENQSHDLLVFGLVVAAAVAAARGAHTRAGAWVGLAAACKATPLLFAVGWVLQRRGRALLGMVAMGVVATLLPDLIAPRGDGQWWVEAWARTFLGGVSAAGTAAAEGAWTAGSELNQSLSGTLHRLVSPVEPNPARFVRDVALFEASPGQRAAVILIGRLLVLGAVIAAVWRRVDGAPARLGQAGAVVCGMVLLSPMSSKSHFCVLLLPLAYAVAVWGGAGRRDRWLACLLVFVFIAGTCTVKGLVGRALGGQLLALGAVTWTAVATLAATLRALHLERVATGTVEPAAAAAVG